MKTTQVDTPGSMGLRMVQIQDPGGNIVQMPRITETEFKAKVKTIRPKALLAPFRRDTRKHIKKCFELDWTMTKMSRLILEEAPSRSYAMMCGMFASCVQFVFTCDWEPKVFDEKVF